MVNRVLFISLGSNLGDREVNLSHAIDFIARQVGPIVMMSSRYETTPWGKSDQPDFLNQVVRVDSPMPPHDVLDSLLSIEQVMGRERKEKWGARLIDLDLLYAGDEIINHGHLTLPHPALAQRKFVLEPLAEIAPDFVHPVLQKTQQELLAACPDELKVTRL